jgi:hypothetical protein
MIKVGETKVCAEFDSGTYMGSFVIDDPRFPYSWHRDDEKGKEIWRAVEIAIAAAVNATLKMYEVKE